MRQIKIGDEFNNIVFRKQTDDSSVEIKVKSLDNIISSVYNVNDLKIVLKFITEGDNNMDASKYAGLSEIQLEKLQEIADAIGTTINELLEKGSPDMIIEQYSNKNFKILND